MTLTEWFATQPRGAASALRARARVGWATIWRAQHGVPLSYAVAKRISLATGGAVPINTLCEPAPESEAGSESLAEAG